MSIFKHFEHLNLSLGQATALNKLETFLGGSTQVFMLKGYAGSGKTTILKGLVEYLDAKDKKFNVMAPTGRAAKVLRDKTGHGVTIHKAIYNFSKLESINKESNDDAEHSFHYFFPINELAIHEQIIIVDESSMISSKESKHELFTFGTNILLDDLLTYAKLQTSANKIIFVGDPAQLPPVGDSQSLALEKDYFDKLGISVDETEMTEVLRQGNNLILANAKELRETLLSEKRPKLTFQYDESSFIKTSPIDTIEKYVEHFPSPEIGDGVVISYSNGQCYHYNRAIREKLFPAQPDIVPGDLVLINNNNYHTYGAELFNGDIAKVVAVSPRLVSQSAPVYCDEGGVKVRREIKMNFREITIRIPSHPNDIQCYIIDSLLHSINKELSICEMRALYINFKIRFDDVQRGRREAGLPVFRTGSEEFRQALRMDPFYNALRVKFGYAITCHKAQGGEWDKVFVDYAGRVGLSNGHLRWCYTATTRGANTVFAINAPHFENFHKLKFNPIGSIGTLPNDALALGGVSPSPFHSHAAHRGKSLKYWEILEKLENTPFRLEKVETSEQNWLERYTVVKDDMRILIQASLRGSGHFVDQFKVQNSVDPQLKTDIENFFNADFKHHFSINYSPEFDSLADLYSRMQEECDVLGITITNVVKGPSYFVTYYLKTDSICSYIQFYYNGQGQLTTAMPKTFNCSNDQKLQALIQNLIAHAH